MVRMDQRPGFHRMPTYNPDAKRRRRFAAFLIISSYISAFMLGGLIYALTS